MNTNSTILAESDAYENVIYIRSQSDVVTLDDGFSQPQGLNSDINGDLFIADTGNSRIVRYAAGFKTAPSVTADPGQYPTGLDTFSNGKWVAVANIASRNGGPGSVTIYKNDKSIGTIFSSSLASAYFCAFDAAGNLFVSGIDGKGLASVGEIPDATSGGSLAYTELTTSNRFDFPGDIQVTTAGAIVYDDQGAGSGSTLYTYKPPVNGSLGSPIQTTRIQASYDAVTFAFSRDMVNFYDVDAGNVHCEYTYPAGKAVYNNLCYVPNAYQPVGIAVLRTQYPKT